jgi:hypothetical protein
MATAIIAAALKWESSATAPDMFPGGSGGDGGVGGGDGSGGDGGHGRGRVSMSKSA